MIFMKFAKRLQKTVMETDVSINLDIVITPGFRQSILTESALSMKMEQNLILPMSALSNPFSL